MPCRLMWCELQSFADISKDFGLFLDIKELDGVAPIKVVGTNNENPKQTNEQTSISKAGQGLVHSFARA